MKIAILMHGSIGRTDKYGTGRTIPLQICKKHFEDKILKVNDKANIDVFMHSWSYEFEDELKQTFRPIKSIIEPQIIFDFEYVVGDPNGLGGEIIRWRDGKFKGLDNLRFHSLFSRWYSAKVVNDLKIEHEKENNFEYDMVMLTRPDLAYLVDFDFFKMDKSKLYLIGPDSEHHGVHDLWFILNSNNMNKFAGGMYDYLKSIKHFPGKFTHSHYYARKFLIDSGLYANKQFFGSERPWGQAMITAKSGPSPCVRHHYDLQDMTPDEDMAKVREYIKKVSVRTITNE
mgnify:CR=1 FL=1|tara:strand:- start:8549 stop:9406 length:858 start_codon:yes stop_codon:yes gene_type:complete